MSMTGATRHVLGWFAPFWKGRWKGMLGVMGITLFAILLSTAYPVIFKFVIDSLSEGMETSDVQFYVWIILLVGLARTLTRWVLPSTRYVMNLLLGMDIKLHHFENLLRKNPEFFDKFRSGDLITRFSDDIDGDVKLAWFANSGIMRPIEASFTLLFSIAVMMTLHWKLTLLAVSPLPLIVWAMSKTEHRQHKAYKRRQETISLTNNILESAFSGVRIVVGFVMEHAQDKLFRENMKERKAAEERVVFIRSILESIGSLINQVGLVVVLFVGGYYVIPSEITLGDFYAFIAYMTGITEPIWTISWFFVSLKMSESSVERLEDIEGFENRPEASGLPTRPVQHLEVRDLVYGFEDQQVLSGLDMDVRMGERVGVVGAVGSGKTVLVKLLSGWFSPKSGSVRINGMDLTEFSDRARADVIAYVPQDIELFSGSIEDNIRMGREQGLDLKLATKLAVIGDELDLDKHLEQGGVGLSGGQKARVALARALYGDAPIQIFDDVTSALDLKTEQRLWKLLSEQDRQRMYLVTTHREATAAQMDRILWIKEGRIFQEGQHADLLARFPDYRTLFARD